MHKLPSLVESVTKSMASAALSNRPKASGGTAPGFPEWVKLARGPLLAAADMLSLRMYSLPDSTPVEVNGSTFADETSKPMLLG